MPGSDGSLLRTPRYLSTAVFQCHRGFRVSLYDIQTLTMTDLRTTKKGSLPTTTSKQPLDVYEVRNQVLKEGAQYM